MMMTTTEADRNLFPPVVVVGVAVAVADIAEVVTVVGVAQKKWRSEMKEFDVEECRCREIVVLLGAPVHRSPPPPLPLLVDARDDDVCVCCCPIVFADACFSVCSGRRRNRRRVLPPPLESPRLFVLVVAIVRRELVVLVVRNRKIAWFHHVEVKVKVDE